MAADFPQVSFRGCALCPLVPAFWAQFAWVSRLVTPSGCIQVRSRSAVVARRFVLEHLSGLLPREPPVDLRPALVGPTIPSLGLPLQLSQIRNPAFTQTLTRVQAEFDFRLIEPASVFGGVVHGEPVPNVSALLLAEVIGQRFAAVYVEVVHHEVNRFCSRVLPHDVPHHARELGAGAVGGGCGEVAAGLRFHYAKYVRCAAPFILIVLLGRFSRLGRYRRPHVIVQRDRFLIQANDGLGRIIGLLIDAQRILHLFDVFRSQFGHGRGRDAGDPAPPAQIPTSGITA